jgi:outer membrane lipopolysaccharide assembly protein LptE/RlpB
MMCYLEVRMKGRILGLVIMAAGLLSSVGCGYHLVGTSDFLPEELKILYVAPFENLTSWADMDQRLGEALNREWVRRRRFELVNRPEESDLVLKGTISSIRVAPVTFDESGRATEYQMTLRASVQLVDARGEEPEILWEDQGFSRQSSYDVDESAANYFDRQMESMEILSRDFARSLVSAVLEGF